MTLPVLGCGCALGLCRGHPPAPVLDDLLAATTPPDDDRCELCLRPAPRRRDEPCYCGWRRER